MQKEKEQDGVEEWELSSMAAALTTLNALLLKHQFRMPQSGGRHWHATRIHAALLVGLHVAARAQRQRGDQHHLKTNR